ncbi:uncharacterized protein LOC113291592 [Papaver somniferum]|uniref:uncharacterized protein LOC113291592 n=1 Tax=Papaver somniferum TaxID=3469 RepID=UPI000E6FDB44|nr:uncharacterized protein LOC113291592 [Papaver somniferum]
MHPHDEVDSLMSLITDFSACSGQVINIQKSGCFFSKNCNPDFFVSLIRQLNIGKIDLNEKYLGIPLFIRRSKSEAFGHLADHFDKRAAKWKAYRVISSQNRTQLSTQQSKVYKDSWNTPVLPKVQLFLWKCIRNILPTKSRVFRFTTEQDNLCILCDDSMIETAEHLLLHCFFSKAIWAIIPGGNLVLQDSSVGIDIHTWIYKWISSCKDKTMLCQILTTAWTIWRDRCFKNFQGKSQNATATASYAMKIAGETIQSVTITHTPTITQVIIPQHTLMVLPSNCIMMYCDAPYINISNKIGIGIYLVDETGNYGGCKTITGITRDSEEAESLAILVAADWERSLNFEAICINSDAKNPVSFFKNKNNQTSWFSNSILEDSILF